MGTRLLPASKRGVRRKLTTQRSDNEAERDLKGEEKGEAQGSHPTRKQLGGGEETYWIEELAGGEGESCSTEKGLSHNTQRRGMDARSSRIKSQERTRKKTRSEKQSLAIHHLREDVSGLKKNGRSAPETNRKERSFNCRERR